MGHVGVGLGLALEEHLGTVVLDLFNLLVVLEVGDVLGVVVGLVRLRLGRRVEALLVVKEAEERERAGRLAHQHLQRKVVIRWGLRLTTRSLHLYR